MSLLSSATARIQNWPRSLAVGQNGVDLVINLLEQLRSPIPYPRSGPWYRTVAVRNLEQEIDLQRLGIDLLWFVNAASCTCVLTIEVKADLNSHTGNFFLETVSDVDRKTPGAFLSSTAEWYFYTFPGIETVYCLPLFDTRQWFLENQLGFKEKTATSSHAGRFWRTTGSLVSIERLIHEVPGVKSFRRQNGSWEEILAF